MEENGHTVEFTYDEKRKDVAILEPGSGLWKLWALWKLITTSKKITLRRVANLLIVYSQWKFFRTRKSYGYPFKLIIDPTSICQLQCPLCPTGQGDLSRGKGLMSMEDYKRIVDEVAPYTICLDLFNWGEPLLHNHLPEMIEYANKKGLVTRVSVNLNHFSKEMAKSIVESQLDVMVLSIDGASPETYVQYRRGGDFNKVIEHVKWIVEEKRKQKSQKPLMEWQFLIMKHNEHEILLAKKMAAEIGVDKVAFRPVRCDMGKEVFMTDEMKLKKTRSWLPSTDKLSRYDYEKKERKIQYKYCPHLWTKSIVNWDGSVSPCCGIYNRAYDFGNAFQEKSLKAVWNNPTYQRAREMVANLDKDAKDNIVCKNCLITGYID